MSTSSSPPSPPHRLAVIMSPEGRFLQCRDCQLTRTFPDGIKFGVIAKQFGAHSCVTPMHRPAWHNDRRFVILRYDGKVPALASCARCERKFFTPSALIRDASGAEEYLGSKFDVHECDPDPQREYRAMLSERQEK
jgi:hypothetical protein